METWFACEKHNLVRVVLHTHFAMDSHVWSLNHVEASALIFDTRLSEDVERFLAAHEILFVIEQNRDAQLRSLLTLETQVDKSKLRSLLHYNGLPISSAFIVEGVLAELHPQAKPKGAAHA